MLVVYVTSDEKKIKFRKISTDGTLDPSGVGEAYSGSYSIAWGRCAHLSGDLFSFTW